MGVEVYEPFITWQCKNEYRINSEDLFGAKVFRRFANYVRYKVLLLPPRSTRDRANRRRTGA